MQLTLVGAGGDNQATTLVDDAIATSANQATADGWAKARGFTTDWYSGVPNITSPTQSTMADLQAWIGRQVDSAWGVGPASTPAAASSLGSDDGSGVAIALGGLALVGILLGAAAVGE